MSRHSITRVELHGAITKADYDGLHNVMFINGFSREIQAKAGKARQLPTATYYMLVGDEITVLDLTETVRNIISSYWKSPKTFETLSTIGDVAWYNLPIAP